MTDPIEQRLDDALTLALADGHDAMVFLLDEALRLYRERMPGGGS